MVPEKNRVVVTLQLNATRYLFNLQNAAINAEETLYSTQFTFIMKRIIFVLKTDNTQNAKVQLPFSNPSLALLAIICVSVVAHSFFHIFLFYS